jgi:hypothetical protein
MVTPRKQHQDYGARWADAFGRSRQGGEEARGNAGGQVERDDDELMRQLRLVRDATVKHAAILRTLAER